MKILIFCLPGIGDALMATPMVSLLKKKYPHADIDIACMFGGVAYVYKNNPAVHKVYQLKLYNVSPVLALKEILTLRAQKYDISILTMPSYRREYALMQWIVHAKKRISTKYMKGYWGEFHFLNTDTVIVDESVHNVINNLHLLSPLGIDWQKVIPARSIAYELPLEKKDVTQAKQYIKNLGWQKEVIVGIHPGSTLSPAALLKRWPVEKYAKVAKYLIKRNVKIMIFVGLDEKDLGVKLLALINDTKNTHLIDVSFGQAVALVSELRFLICNDNGFAHIANALKIKTVVLWGITNPIWNRPYTDALVISIFPETFNPWYRYDLKREIPEGCVGNIETISEKQVIQAVNTLL